MISTQFTAIWVRHNLCSITKECVPHVYIVCFSAQNEKNTLWGKKGGTFEAKFRFN